MKTTINDREQLLISVRMTPELFYDGYVMLIGIRDLITGKLKVAKPIEMVEHDESCTIPYDSFIPFDKKVAQKLMDDLWGLGLKPTQMKDQSETIGATKYHLEDMRKIAFDFIKGVTNEDINDQ